MTKEEIKELNNIIFDKLNTKEYSSILGEYTRLIQENKHLNEQLDVALKDYDELQQRIDKALEYINHAQNYGKEKSLYINGDDLLEILKGEENE